MTHRNPDLERTLARMDDARARLLAAIRPLEAGDLTHTRPGGWTVGRILQHLIDSDVVYTKLLAHQTGRAAPGLSVAEPADGHAAVGTLKVSSQAVTALVEDIPDDVLYRIVSFGREEYSPLSVIENIAAHDAEHLEQIEELLAAASPRPRATAPAVPGVTLRAAGVDDLPRLTEIYNHYIINTPITFDLDAVTVGDRRPWLDQFEGTGRHRLLVAEDGGGIAGYAGSHQFRTKAAYDTTVETTIYVAPEACGRGIGPMLYSALFDALAGEDIRMMVAGITLPNPASVALHERFGFERVGVMHAVGRKFDQYWDVGWYERPAP